jgi:hypothetical protein
MTTSLWVEEHAGSGIFCCVTDDAIARIWPVRRGWRWSVSCPRLQKNDVADDVVPTRRQAEEEALKRVTNWALYGGW